MYARLTKIEALLQEDAPGNIALLQHDVDTVELRRQTLKQQWHEFRKPLRDQLEQLLVRETAIEVGSSSPVSSSSCVVVVVVVDIVVLLLVEKARSIQRDPE